MKFSSAAIDALQRHSWPGNIRELRNTVERLILLSSGGEVGMEDVRSVIGAVSVNHAHTSYSGTLAERVEQFEREVILSEMKRSGFHMTNAAKSLGLERSHLYKKAEQLGIDVRKTRRDEEN